MGRGLLMVVGMTATLLCGQERTVEEQKGRIEGRVMNSVTGEPVRKARVRLAPATEQQAGRGQRAADRVATTDAEGRFVFEKVEAGSFFVNAERQGFDEGAGWGFERRGKPPVVARLGPGEKTDVTLKLDPTCVVAGRVTDEEGEPMQAVQVGVLVWNYTENGRRLVHRQGSSTDDRGEYRIWGLPAGRYYLAASTRRTRWTAEDRDVYRTVYYPSSEEAVGAAPVELAAGQVLEGVDFVLRRSKGLSIRGRVVKPAGVGRVNVYAMKPDIIGNDGNSGRVNEADGKFEIAGLAPGEYFVGANSQSGPVMYQARQAVTLSGNDAENVELLLAPPFEVKGTIRLEGMPDSNVGQVRVMLLPVSGDYRMQGGGGQWPVKEDGSFVLRNIMPGEYFVQAFVQGGGFLKSARFGDLNVLEAGLSLSSPPAAELNLVWSGAGGEMSGAVANEKGDPMPFAVVTLVPQGAASLASFSGQKVSPLARIRFRSTDTDLNGRYSLKGIPPGNYRAFAWEWANRNAVLWDEEFMKPHTGKGKDVVVKESGKETLDLKVIPAPEK
jgi:hypothetical protein